MPGEPGSVKGQVVAEQRWRRVEGFEDSLDVQREMRDLYGRTLALLERAEASGELPGALRAVREVRNNLELLGRLSGVLGGPQQVPPTKIEVVYVQKCLLPGTARSLDGGNE
jgi:hypothetical protein